MRGTRAKLLRKASVQFHTPEKAAEVLTKTINKSAPPILGSDGKIERKVVQVTIKQHHPDSLRGAYQRVKATYKKWMASAKRQGGYAI